MGINIHVYSYWGVRTGWDDEFSSAQDEVYERNITTYGYKNMPADADIDHIADGMSGEYMVFGVQLYDSGDGRWGEMVNSNEVELSGEILDKMREDYIAQFRKLYPDHVHLVDKPWKLVNFVHYS